MAKQSQQKQDASMDAAINGITVLSAKIAERAGVEIGTVVPWAVAFPVCVGAVA